uniref:Uncharacterized protein n=1 Tax=Rhizophora mucronata TaxID=61149 RepID=A0A2P2P4P2_RHIMU
MQLLTARNFTMMGKMEQFKHEKTIGVYVLCFRI